MPSLSQEQQLSVAPEIQPQLRTKIQNRLLAYAKADAAYEKAKDELDKLHGDLVDLLAVSGEKELNFPGYGKLQDVDGGMTKSLDRKKLLAMGVTEAQLRDATTEKPRKGHVLVTPAGSR